MRILLKNLCRSAIMTMMENNTHLKQQITSSSNAAAAADLCTRLADVKLLSKEKDFDKEHFERIIKVKFFYAPSFDIYKGVAGFYDLGPPGCALQANIISLWRSHFVTEEDMLEVDSTLITLEDV